MWIARPASGAGRRPGSAAAARARRLLLRRLGQEQVDVELPALAGHPEVGLLARLEPREAGAQLLVARDRTVPEAHDDVAASQARLGGRAGRVDRGDHGAARVVEAEG